MVLQKLLAASTKRVMISEQLSIPGLAEKAGIAKSSAQGYLHEQGNPRADTIELVCENLGCPLEKLLYSGQHSELSNGPPDFRALATDAQTIHPALERFLHFSFQMAKEVPVLSEELYRREKEEKDGEE